jgi:hypothetical protein
VNQRWRYGGWRASPDSIEEAQGWEEAKEGTRWVARAAAGRGASGGRLSAGCARGLRLCKAQVRPRGSPPCSSLADAAQSLPAPRPRPPSGLHFLAVQPDPDSEELTGLWLLQDRMPPNV